MKRFICRRLITGILTIFIVFVLNFLLIQAAPGSPVTTLMGKENHDPEIRAMLEEKYGFDKPVIVQLGRQLEMLFHGDLGDSIIQNRPVGEMIAEKLGPTIVLGLTSALLALIIGTPLGVMAARKEGKPVDMVVSGTQYVFSAMPQFWLGLMLIILFSSNLDIFPSYGMTDARADHTGINYVIDVLYHMCLPAITLTLTLIPQYFKIAKSSVLQVTNEEFIQTFKAAGMPVKQIFRKYILRNAILPTVTIFGISMAYLLTGVMLIEIVFAWPGMGRLMMTAINQRDYPTLIGINLIMAISVAVVMLLVDIIYAKLDPRIRYE